MLNKDTRPMIDLWRFMFENFMGLICCLLVKLSIKYKVYLLNGIMVKTSKHLKESKNIKTAKEFLKRSPFWIMNSFKRRLEEIGYSNSYMISCLALIYFSFLTLNVFSYFYIMVVLLSMFCLYFRSTIY
jgi:hypothetical protein